MVDASGASPKRLRGGGGDGGDFVEGDDAMFDDDFVDMIEEEEDPADFIPNDMESFEDTDSVIAQSKSNWARPPLVRTLENNVSS